MKIGIDFDDTIVKTKEKVKEYLIKYNLPGFSNFEEKRLFYNEHIDEMTSSLELKDDVILVLNKLALNNELYLITARNNFYSDNVERLVLEYIKDKNIPIKNINFDCSSKEKALKCKELNIDLFIDDLVENCLEAKRMGINTLLFQGEYEGLSSINNWNEILKYVEDNNGRENCNK